jgi:hypothetical protein
MEYIRDVSKNRWILGMSMNTYEYMRQRQGIVGTTLNDARKKKGHPLGWPFRFVDRLASPPYAAHRRRQP